jgi:hypothetical protein
VIATFGGMIDERAIRERYEARLILGFGVLDLVSGDQCAD